MMCISNLKKKRIAIFCVNYNSYDECEKFIQSVNLAAKQVSSKVQINIYVIDNTTNDYQAINIQNSTHCQVKVFEDHNNVGYFGGIRRMMSSLDCLQFDYSIISNVDVQLSSTFFEQLFEINDITNVGWIAPQIYSTDENRDRNPKILHRYSLNKLKVLKLFYKYPLLNLLYTLTVYKRKKMQNYSAGTEIYAGHGSFIILTQEYIRRSGIIDYPVFLFGEEIYLGEKCREYNLKVVYEPQIKVIDSEHASTQQLKKSFYNRCNIEALNYIIHTYY